MPPTSSWNSSNQKSGKENSFPRLTFLRTQHSFFFSNLLRNNMITSVLLVSRCRSRHKDTNLRAIHNRLFWTTQNVLKCTDIEHFVET